jgi:diguanylate cyclase (GGDEF)-like protein
MIYDITETKQLLDQVSLMAERDALTGLMNRGAFYQKGTSLLSKMAGHHSRACLFMIDIDFFKKVNDTYGHLKGDDVLKTVAGMLSAHLRKTDLVARYGGEEFCAFLPDISQPAAVNVAEKLRERAEALEFSVDEAIFRITISIGLAMYDRTRHESLEALLATADALLYAAKNSGRNKVVWHQAE